LPPPSSIAIEKNAPPSHRPKKRKLSTKPGRELEMLRWNKRRSLEGKDRIGNTDRELV
jgi:hypothetical protein